MSDGNPIDLQFKPLSEGLGFHPFSNGLPYTPMAPSRPKHEPSSQGAGQGTGAVAAGRPSFAFPQPRLPQPKLSLQPSLSQPRPAALVTRPPLATLSPAAAPAPVRPAPAPLLAAPPELAPKVFGWDYVGRRFFAYCIDSAIGFALGLGILVASLWSSLEIFASTDVLLGTVAFLLFFNWALIAAQEVAFGSSVGKKLFGLHIEGGPVALLVRALMFIPGALLFGAGVFWCALDSNHRAFHDRVTGIQPEEN